MSDGMFKFLMWIYQKANSVSPENIVHEYKYVSMEWFDQWTKTKMVAKT